MHTEALRDLVVRTLEDRQAINIQVLDVQSFNSIADFFIIASGTSNRHVTSTAEEVALQAKRAGEPALGVEGLPEGEWALVDLDTVIVHIMQDPVREYYQIEKLWSTPAK
jgi:ribosome-associated protein